MTPLEKLICVVLDSSACPAQRDLALLLNVSLRTVQHALSSLARKGRLTVLPRSAGRGNRYIIRRPDTQHDERRELLAKVRGRTTPYRPSGDQLFLRTEHYQEYLRSFCRKPDRRQSRP